MSAQESDTRTSEDETKTGECRGTKRHSEEHPENVRSANDWEHADLGDTERKNKFLRLMGAGKRQHHGRIVIGEKAANVHGRSFEETEKLNSELEDQYRQGLELKMSGGARRHTGLGFQEPEPPAPQCSEEVASRPEDGLTHTASEATIDAVESKDGDAYVPETETSDAAKNSSDEKEAGDNGVAFDNEETSKAATGVAKGFVRGDAS